MLFCTDRCDKKNAIQKLLYHYLTDKLKIINIVAFKMSNKGVNSVALDCLRANKIKVDIIQHLTSPENIDQKITELSAEFTTVPSFNSDGCNHTLINRTITVAQTKEVNCAQFRLSIPYMQIIIIM